MSLYRDYTRLSSEPVSQTDGGSHTGATTRHIGGVTRLGEEPAPPPAPPEEPAPEGIPLTEYTPAPTIGELMAQQRANRLRAAKVAKEAAKPAPSASSEHELYRKFVGNPNRRTRD